jgi:hypothetical protein
MWPMARGTRRSAVLPVVFVVYTMIYAVEGRACPSANASTYNLYAPEHVLTVDHTSTHCPAAQPNPPSECLDSVVYLPGVAGSADPENLHLLPSLFVYLSGAGGDADTQNSDILLKTAAFAGYRTIGLSYYDVSTVEEECEGILCQLDYEDECAYQMRMERLTGVDNPNTPDHVVPPETAIVYRLLEVLQELEAWDTADLWDFEEYCVDSLGGCSTIPNGPWLDRIHWDRIVLAGFSHGAGYGHLVSLLTEVDGIVSIDGGNDRCALSSTPNDNRASSYLQDLGSIWSQTGGGSPGNGEFAAIHQVHAFNGMVSPEIVPDSYPYVQLYTTVHQLDGTGAASLPLASNVLRTNQNWPNTDCLTVLGYHGSMATDNCMPTQATWNKPDQDDVEASPLEYPPDVHLFPAYVEGFCNARAL